MKVRTLIILLVILALGGFWGYRKLFPGDEVMIRRQLKNLAELATVRGVQSDLVKLSMASEFASGFTAAAKIHVDFRKQGEVLIEGRQTLLPLFLNYRNQVGNAEVKLFDVQVDFSRNKDSAIVQLTAVADIDGERNAVVEELSFVFKKVEGDWLIDQVTNVQVLR